MTQTFKVKAVVYQENGVWVAHCLEHSFVSCSENLGDLPNELFDQVREQIEVDLAAGRTPFQGFKRAPQKYWDMLEAAKTASSQPLRPKKTLAVRWREVVKRWRVRAELFPVQPATV